MKRRDRVIFIVAFLGFIVAWMSKAAGKVSFIEGTILFVGFIVVVTVGAIIVELVRKS